MYASLFRLKQTRNTPGTKHQPPDRENVCPARPRTPYEHRRPLNELTTHAKRLAKQSVHHLPGRSRSGADRLHHVQHDPTRLRCKRARPDARGFPELQQSQVANPRGIRPAHGERAALCDDRGYEIPRRLLPRGQRDEEPRMGHPSGGTSLRKLRRGEEDRRRFPQGDAVFARADGGGIPRDASDRHRRRGRRARLSEGAEGYSDPRE